MALGHAFHAEAIGLHHGAVVLLVGAAKLYGHGELVVEVGQRGVGIKGTGIENLLGRLLNELALLVGGRGPREVVVDHVFRIAVAHL